MRPLPVLVLLVALLTLPASAAPASIVVFLPPIAHTHAETAVWVRVGDLAPGAQTVTVQLAGATLLRCEQLTAEPVGQCEVVGDTATYTTATWPAALGYLQLRLLTEPTSPGVLAVQVRAGERQAAREIPIRDIAYLPLIPQGATP